MAIAPIMVTDITSIHGKYLTRVDSDLSTA